MSRIMTIDPGYSALGYAVGEENKLIEYGTVYFKGKEETRLTEIYLKIKELIQRHNPDTVLIEDYRVYKDGYKGKHKTAIVVGIICAIAYEHKIKPTFVFHNSWKAKFQRVYFTIVNRLSEEWKKALGEGSEHSRDAVMMLLPEVVSLKALLKGG
ncbi:hypothetical protein Hydth_0528 [Hydrogenobacter thermophilus TK-6]|uniref:Uncharacterized protein n=1 Tax=Hydrogenobacter thermophilus (strain DSM 6534 / IAM 12695 / TK-6) TaxID=608538 RepID=D3DGP2_HYDTT|nr:crossover junction endodeoxyribonuclease RuvC [Hydrogenobacter thermophilus]ADO44928.1 hypothetical protein Hydth_0528 [Hydrogenobacter thermophilus TK-6]BAI68994.1 hypothetical protein HTH_0531 [Hydrogenobacter thermophilus TK-6]